MLVWRLGNPAVLQKPQRFHVPKILYFTLNFSSFLVAATSNEVKVDEL
jgi:hypothetical protein